MLKSNFAMQKSKRVSVENWYRPGSLKEGRKSRWLLWEKTVSHLGYCAVWDLGSQAPRGCLSCPGLKAKTYRCSVLQKLADNALRQRLHTLSWGHCWTGQSSCDNGIGDTPSYALRSILPPEREQMLLRVVTCSHSRQKLIWAKVLRGSLRVRNPPIMQTSLLLLSLGSGMDGIVKWVLQWAKNACVESSHALSR
jgi:hypothetical protein